MSKLRKREFRLKNKDYRNKHRKTNYAKSRPDVRKHRTWTEEEIYSLNNWETCSDRELANHWNRSVQAIQQKRYELKKINA